MIAPVGKEAAGKAKDLILSVEVLPNGILALYARRIGEPVEGEKTELAENGPGNNSPANVLKRLIKRVAG